MRLLSLWILAALPALAAPKEGSWLTLPSGRAVCVSPVPAAGKLKKPEREAYEAVVADLLAGKDAATIGRELSVNPTEHPWVDSLAVAAGVAAATPDADRAVALAEAWPADPCLAATAAVALVLRDGEGVDGAKVEDLAGRAWLPISATRWLSACWPRGSSSAPRASSTAGCRLRPTTAI